MLQVNWTAPAALSLAWGLSFVFVHSVVGGFSWTLAVTLTSLAYAVAIYVPARLGGHVPSRRANLRRVAVLTGWVTVQNVGLCLAMGHLGLALTAIVLGSTPLFSTVVGQVWGVERITPAGVLGLVVGFLGLLLVLLFPVNGDSWAFISGMLACLLSAFASAFATRYADQRLSDRPDAVAGAQAGAALVGVPLVLVSGGFSAGTPWAWASLLGLLLVVGLAGPVLYVLLPRAEQAATVNHVKTAGMVLAVLVGVVILGEGLSAGQVVGLLLVLGGSALALDLVPLPTSARSSR